MSHYDIELLAKKHEDKLTPHLRGLREPDADFLTGLGITAEIVTYDLSTYSLDELAKCLEDSAVPYQEKIGSLLYFAEHAAEDNAFGQQLYPRFVEYLMLLQQNAVVIGKSRESLDELVNCAKFYTKKNQRAPAFQ